MAKKDKGGAGTAVTYQIRDPAGGVKLETFIPWTLVKRGVKKEVITPLDASEEFQEEALAERQVETSEAESVLVRALGLAHHWQRLLDEGRYRSISEIAAAESMDVGQVSRIAKLAQLAPGIIEAGVAGGNVPPLESLFRRSFPADWGKQKQEIAPDS